MSKFKKDKGKVVLGMPLASDLRITIHENTSPELVSMFKNAIEKARKQDNEVSK